MKLLYIIAPLKSSRTAKTIQSTLVIKHRKN